MSSEKKIIHAPIPTNTPDKKFMQWDDNTEESEITPLNISDNDESDFDGVDDNYFGDLSTIGVEEIRLLLKYMSKGYKVPKIIEDTIWKVAKIEIEDKDKYVIYKRDPNVERRRISSAKVVIVDGKSIQVNNVATIGFGADFDGDSVDAKVDIKVIQNHQEDFLKNLPLSDIPDLPYFRFIDVIKKENIIVYKYEVVDGVEVQILSINTETGKPSYKKITDFSIHDGLKMYKISDIKERFEDFWSSEDHSLIVYDENLGEIIRISPKELMNNKKGRYFLKYGS